MAKLNLLESFEDLITEIQWVLVCSAVCPQLLKSKHLVLQYRN